MDAIDRTLVELLQADARTPNSVLAARAQIAPSTCHARVRSLQERGVLRGYRADVDPAAVGRGLQAMISLRLRVHARPTLKQFAVAMAALPGVLNVFFMAGTDDFLLHIATADAEELRDFVADHLNSNTDIAMTETRLIFDHLSGGGPL